MLIANTQRKNSRALGNLENDNVKPWKRQTHNAKMEEHTFFECLHCKKKEEQFFLCVFSQIFAFFSLCALKILLVFFFVCSPLFAFSFCVPHFLRFGFVFQNSLRFFFYFETQKLSFRFWEPPLRSAPLRFSKTKR